MPFTVITLKKVPTSLRGDLTKWMQEIAEGVYVGNFNSQIRQKLWERIGQNVKDGEATMSFSYRNEIGYSFETLNSRRQIVDYDGIPLVIIPKPDFDENKGKEKLGFSNAYRFRQIKKHKTTSVKVESFTKQYVVIDIETTGLDSGNDKIIEIGAIKITDNKTERYSSLVFQEEKLQKSIINLTGITDKMLREQGRDIKNVLTEFLEFIGDLPIIGYSVDFDIKFLNSALKSNILPQIINRIIDLKDIVKKDKKSLKNYRLETVLKSYGIDKKVPHRALPDAQLTYELYGKVNKFSKNLK